MKKTAVITGASGGIGGAAAIQLAKRRVFTGFIREPFQRKSSKSQTGVHGCTTKQRCRYLFALWGFE